MNIRFKKCVHVWLLFVVAALTTEATPTCAQTAQDGFAMAANHYTYGNWNEAEEAFRELIERHPKSDEATSAKFFLAEVMMQRGAFDPAYRAFQTLLQENPNHEFGRRATFRMGEAAFRTGNYEVAVRILEKFVETSPRHGLNEFALPYLGEMRLKQEEPQLAQRAYETALKMYPNSTVSNSSRLGLAKALQMLGDEAEATRFYQFLLTQDNDDLVGQSHLQLGIIRLREVDYQAAKKHLREAISNCKSDSSQAEAAYWLARTHIEVQEYGPAVALLKTIVDKELPEKLAVSVLIDGAVAATKNDQAKLALRWLKRFRNTFPGNALVDESVRMAIDIHQRRGESDQAIVLMKRFRNEYKNSPLRASVLESEGRIHYAAKRYSEMVDTFEVLLNEHGDSKTVEQSDRANWIYLKSLGHLGLGEFELAESELKKIETGKLTKQLAPLVYIARATAQFGMEDYVAAIESYRGHLRLAPNGAKQKRARAELAVCHAEAGQWDEASVALDDLVAHHADDPLILSTAQYLADKSYQDKQLAHAERWFTLLARPGHPRETIARGLSGLACINMESRDSRSATDVLERLVNEFPDKKSSGEAAMARAKFLETEKEFLQAAQTYALVIRQFGSTPIGAVAKLRRANALQKLGGRLNLAEAETLLSEYLALPSANPLTDEALYQLAWVMHDLGRPDECLSKFAELVESEPESKYWSDAAYRVLQHAVANHDLATAKPLIARLLAKTDAPMEVITRVLFVQGQVAAADNRWADVTQSMSDLAKRTDNATLKTKAEYWLAEALYRQKNYAEALKVYRRLTTKPEQLDPKLQPWIWLRTAQCQGNEGDWSKAVETATKMKDRFPDFESDYEFDFVLGRGLEDSGKLTDAREAYQLVVNSANGGATETAAIAQWRIGETYLHQEEFVNAIKAYHKVDSLFSYPYWRCAAIFQAGTCQEQLNNDKHAIKLYTRLVESFPESEFAKGARERLARLTAQANSDGGKPMNRSGTQQSRR